MTASELPPAREGIAGGVAVPAASPPTVMPPQVGGRYALDGLIGSGGSASVYSGRDTRLGRQVAVKVLDPALAADSGARASFAVEAEAAAMLNHPGIVTVYDVGTDEFDDGSGERPVVWIAMERVTGQTLTGLIAPEAPVPPGEALRIVDGVLAALEHAHAHGVVHRDLSPGNVMITTDGVVKVLDFGLAGSVEPGVGDGVVRASVGYVSPERARGAPADARGDLYSVGCLLFALLTGAPPYVADTVAEVARRHVEAPVPRPSAHRPELGPELGPELDHLVVAALAKQPGNRPQTAARMRAGLQQVAARTATPDATRTQVVPVVRTTTTAFRPVVTRVRPPVPDTRPRSVSSPAALTAARPAGPSSEPGGKGGNAGLMLLLGVVVVAIAAALWFGLRPGGGGASVVVPELAGQDEPAARAAVEAAGLAVGGVRTEAHATAPAGTVIRSEPGAGASAREGSPVLVVVSGGPAAAPTVSVPRFDGMTLREARTAVETIGLVLGEVSREDSRYDEDTVLRSDPAGGAEVTPGAVVTLTVASGAQRIPEVGGLPVGEARARVQDAGFVVVETPGTVDPGDPAAPAVPGGTVIGVQPAAGISLRLGATVTLVVAVTPEPTDPVPGPSTPDPSRSPSPSSTPTPTPTGTGPSVNPVDPTGTGDPTGEPA